MRQELAGPLVALHIRFCFPQLCELNLNGMRHVIVRKAEGTRVAGGSMDRCQFMARSFCLPELDYA